MDFDECSSNPCLNGGTCQDGINQFNCLCPIGYSGHRCESIIDNCSNILCQNGGTCNENFGSCECKENFYGAYCQNVKRVDPWSNCSIADHCNKLFANNVCNEECNTRECFFDGSDCRYQTDLNFGAKNYCNQSAYCEDNFANGHCDFGCNNINCVWDGLDCEKKSIDGSVGELILILDKSSPQMTEQTLIIRRLLFKMSLLLGSVLHAREILPHGQTGTKLIVDIYNQKCIDNKRCFESSREVASFVSEIKNHETPVLNFLRQNKLRMEVNAAESEGDILIHPSTRAHNLTYVVLAIMTLLFIGILLGALVTSNRKKMARGTTWFPEGFFTNQMAPMSRTSRHHNNATANAASGDFSRNRRFGLSHSNSVRSGCPDGQEMRQFKPHDDLLDEKSACAAIYEEPTDCRSWSTAHYEAFQPHDSMTPPLPTPSIDAIGPNGMTPLMVASAFPNTMGMDNPDTCGDNNNAVQDLIMSGANVSLACDKTSETSLHLAARYARADAAKRLIDGGADCNAKDATGQTPLHTAIRSDARGVFEILLRNRTSDLNARNSVGVTPLILAARLANEGMVEQLVLSNCDLNVADDSGKTALHWAASVNNVEAVKVLLQHGADRDAKNVREETPLFLAAREGAYQCAKLLLDYHANRDITDHMDRLPRDVALERMHTDIVALLDEHEPSKVPPPSITSLNNNSNSSNANVTSPVSWNSTGVGGTLGRNTTRRKAVQHQHQLSSLSQMSQQYHSTNNINNANNASNNTLTSMLSSNGTLKKVPPPTSVPPPPPPPRNCVALYNTHSPNPPQPILLLGSGAPDNSTISNQMHSLIQNGQYGATTITPYTTQTTPLVPLSQTPQQSQMTSQFHDFSPPNSMLTTSALISPPSRPPPAYEDCFKQHQQQPIAVAPRHVINNSQPLTPTATTAPTIANGYNTMTRFQMIPVAQSTTQSQAQHMHHYHPSQPQRPTDSYPTPSPDSWGSLSTSSPLSAHDWPTNNGMEMVANTPGGTIMTNTGPNGTAGGTQMGATMVMSPTSVTGNIPQTNLRFQPSSTQQAVFI